VRDSRKGEDKKGKGKKKVAKKDKDKDKDKEDIATCPATLEKLWRSDLSPVVKTKMLDAIALAQQLATDRVQYVSHATCVAIAKVLPCECQLLSIIFNANMLSCLSDCIWRLFRHETASGRYDDPPPKLSTTWGGSNHH
jgi:hypothetical protein